PIPRAPAAERSASAGSNNASATSTPLPALPAPASTASPAALTSGSANPSLEPGRDLRIGAGLGNAAPPPSGSLTANPTRAVRRTPQPVSDGNYQQISSVQPVSDSATTGQGSPGQGNGYQQLQEALNARGVTWRRLETVVDTNEWKFTCSLPSCQNPN